MDLQLDNFATNSRASPACARFSSSHARAPLASACRASVLQIFVKVRRRTAELAPFAGAWRRWPGASLSDLPVSFRPRLQPLARSSDGDARQVAATARCRRHQPARGTERVQGRLRQTGTRGRIYGYILAGELLGAGFGFGVAGGLAALSWRASFLALSVERNCLRQITRV